MLTLSNISKSYGSQVLFAQLSLSVVRGERVGLIGRNGHGKSTLLKIIAGKDSADEGNIEFAGSAKLGYLEQHLHFKAPTVLDEVAAHLSQNVDGADESFRAKRILGGLGFSESDMNRPPSEFSGGFQVRIALACLLVSEPELLLLDEPTNYLDIVSIRWLEKFLASWRGALVLVTHDSSFMDAVCTHTAMLHRGSLVKRECSTEALYQAIEEQEELYEKTLENKRKKREQTEQFINRFRAKASKAKQVQSRIKALEREGALESLGEIDELDFSFPFLPFHGRKMGNVEDLSFGFTSEPLFHSLTFTINPNDRIAIVGKNGTGKTTLLEVIAGNLAARDGRISLHKAVQPGYYGQTNIERLNPELSIEEEILEVHPERSRTRARGLAGLMMFSGEAALKQIKVLSGGERARVLLAKLLAKPANLLLLDEPTHHLDIYSARALEQAIAAFDGAVICVTHDETLLRSFAKRLVVFQGGGASLFEGSYDEFLETQGWEDENSAASQNKRREKLSKKELRQLRAKILAERSALLAPVLKQIAQCEQKIEEKEKEIELLRLQLVDATKDGFGKDGEALSRSLHGLQASLEGDYESLEALDAERLAAEERLSEKSAQLEM